MLDFDDEYDYRYEEFREHSGHITDFDMHQEPQYRAAVEKYNALRGEEVMEVREGYHRGCGGLYNYETGPLDEFWAIFKAEGQK